MSLLIQYLVKLSISLSIVWLFYQFILRRLTFYNSNRWYLLGYTLVSFFIPFINISSLIGNNSGSENNIIQLIPSVHQYTIALEEASQCPAPIWSTSYDKWDWTAFALMTGAAILLLRFIIRYVSFLRIRKRSTLISADGIKVYQVDDSIIPFSFGNAVFINSSQHTEDELREIVRHEFVHVRQRHTIDIIWAEMLCIINWYNPFAWLLKISIRQNLEFIADNKVVQNGIDKKEYQYLLLKVIGNNQYSIATQFNFSSLKKRIAMMNKTKTAKRHVGRFLLLFPLFAIILLSFRKSFTEQPTISTSKTPTVLTDTIPDVTIANSKGFYIGIKDDKGNCTVVIKDKDKKEVKRLLLTEWNEKTVYYENLYGEILSPFLPEIEKSIKTSNPDVRTVTVKGNIATVTLKNGKQEFYTLSLSPEKKAFEEKYCLPETAIIETESLIEVRIANAETIPVVSEVRVDETIETRVANEAITITGIKSPANAITTIRSVPETVAELKEIVVAGTKSPANSSIAIKSIPAIELEVTEVAVSGLKSTSPLSSTYNEKSLGVAEVRGTLHLGGLTILDEGQYILLDGKEVRADSYGKLKGPYRIIFVDKKDAERKYGSKAKNGAIQLETIKSN